MSPDEQKRTAGEAAATLIEDGMTVGLGTGSTAAWFVKALSVRGLSVRGVPTSEATAAFARALGIAVVDLDAAGPIDITVDGADEIGPGLGLIKGGGAALLREKLVWSASKRCVVIADAGKAMAKLGKSPLPIEVVAFGHTTTARRIAAAARTCRIANPPELRIRDGAPVRTDSGNLIYDLPCGVIDDPAALAAALKGLTGVVEHGLFLGLAERALIGTDSGVTTLYPGDEGAPRG
jgi:ribose 5-phosphate isomerase A